MAKGVAAVNQVLRCAPQAFAETKRLVRASLTEPLGRVLDEASHMFAASLAGEASEGIRAFIEKRKSGVGGEDREAVDDGSVAIIDPRVIPRVPQRNIRERQGGEARRFGSCGPGIPGSPAAGNPRCGRDEHA